MSGNSGDAAHVGAPVPENEEERLRSLQALGMLDTSPEERFDRVTRLATRLFDVPIALVSLVDTDRQWFKSRVGLEATETPREMSFCAHAVHDDAAVIVRDARLDSRFATNPLVLEAPSIRFYAGQPLKAPDGNNLGTLCVIGDEPRDFSEEDELLLRDLADMVEGELKAIALAMMDELTGLSNRRGVEAVGRHVVEFCKRVGRPATALMFDLDEFKPINDTHGHAEGDRVLQGFGAALVHTFRESDVVARIGGDEFFVLLSGGTPDHAKRPLEQLRARMDDWDAPYDVKYSVGVTEYDPEEHESFADLLAASDHQMYSDKDGR